MRSTVKNRLAKIVIAADYFSEAHPSTVAFWKQLPEKHIYSQHPVFKQHGENLSLNAYKFVKQRFKRDPNELRSIFQAIMKIELEHEEELEELAKNLVAKLWNIDKDMLEPRLDNPQATEQSTHQPMKELDPELIKQIHKRISLNALSHGAAVHSMMTLHHMASKEIERIDPELLELYDAIAAGSVAGYWMIALPQAFEALAGQRAGTTEVVWEEEKPIVIARALIFPVLLQELIKGVMELLSLQGLTHFDESVLTTIYHHADKLEDEPWLIQIGPELWRKFLKIVPKGYDLKTVVLKAAKMDPEELHDLLEDAILDPERAKEYIEAILRN